MVVVLTRRTLHSLHKFVKPQKGVKKMTAGDEDILRIVERFALMLTQSGMPRMPSRVFAYALADDRDQLTAGDFATGLRVSPAAISGALRYLLQIDMIRREREPGARVDHYRLPDDMWFDLYMKRLAVMDSWEGVLAEGVDLLGPDRPGGARLREAREFVHFIREDLPAVMERWHRHRDTL
jgi:hypothetical protein